LEEFRKLLSESYLFHLHTNYTDGELTCEDYFKFAFDNNIKALIFTEHVRKKLDYNFDSFVDEIKTSATKYPNVNYKIGVEAKIIPGGDLDINESILKDVEIICFACHSFPVDINLYFNSFKKLFKNKKWKKFIRVWVHPRRFLEKNNLLKNNLELFFNLIDIAKEESIFIEQNINNPEHYYIKGFDIHTKKQLILTKDFN